MNWLALIGALALGGSGVLGLGEEHGPGDAVTATPPAAQTGDQETLGPAGSAVAHDPLVDIIAMQAERNRRMTVPVTIMGQGPFRFMVDTGAQATVLSSELAERLQLNERDSALLVGMASSRSVETTIVPEFALGGRTLTIRTAPIVAGSNIGSADGILGLDSLQDQRVLLDFDNDELRIADSLSAGGVRGYDIVVRARERLGQLIVHRARIDGISTAVIIDTGAQSSIGNIALRDRMRRRNEMADTIMTDVNGIQITGETRIVRTMDLGEVRLSNFAVAFAEAPTFAQLGLADRPAMILGMNELRMFSRVAIDFHSRRILFDMPEELSRDQSWNFNERATRLR
ncbi:retroviral-like aspartic protease family protein [Aurantiacibacter marinus]|uniref:retroviral-like aspartic protease family protein n=1 Tax=Aurantiacibacter marinus TaxID=874156 RepID=UPI00069A398A|nr:retroviral-like aspartic protease family protein [Aurantiacibacter marinus]